MLFNFRSDRIQQLADFLVAHFSRTGRQVTVLSLTQYDTRPSIPALVGRADASGGLADELAAAGLRSEGRSGRGNELIVTARRATG